VEPDAEMREIDALEDDISPLDPAALRIRELISTLELCHHKAERWVHNIIEAIGSGDTAKGLGTRTPGQLHPAERVWQNVCTALTAWCAGSPADSVDITVGDRHAGDLLGRLGQRSPLKEWQVQRVTERVRDFIGWPWLKRNASLEYVPVLEYGTDYESLRRTECPEYYHEHLDCWQETVGTVIRNTEDGKAVDLSLAIAIDLLMPCNWNFIRNLEIVMGAIGGDLDPIGPFVACAWNIKLSPIHGRMRTVCHTLRVFLENRQPDDRADVKLLGLLGEASREKQWLAASLDKTIRLQLGL
jgi:hypothetical protein